MYGNVWGLHTVTKEKKRKKGSDDKNNSEKEIWLSQPTIPLFCVLSSTKLQQSRVQTYHLKQEQLKYSRTSRKLTFLTISTESCFAEWNWWKPLLKAKETPGYWGGFWNLALYSQNGESISLELLPRRSSVTPCRVGRQLLVRWDRWQDIDILLYDEKGHYALPNRVSHWAQSKASCQQAPDTLCPPATTAWGLWSW